MVRAEGLALAVDREARVVVGLERVKVLGKILFGSLGTFGKQAEGELVLGKLEDMVGPDLGGGSTAAIVRIHAAGLPGNSSGWPSRWAG